MAGPTRRYYAARKRPHSLSIDDLYFKFQHLYLLFLERDCFAERGLKKDETPASIKHEASLALTFQPFPITKWSAEEVTEDHIFETLEFLYDHVSKPGTWTDLSTDSGFNYYGYDGYDRSAGRAEFREAANAFLLDYAPGYQLTEDGLVVELGTHGLQHILDAPIVQFDEANVDSKVRDAVSKWRNRHSTLQDKRAAIRELADVFEWLRKTGQLNLVLAEKKDESALFEIANNFAIRHHSPDQKTNYDQAIWYSWIFHFYLATYHAVVRMLIKNRGGGRK
jgi:hypothetical protein